MLEHLLCFSVVRMAKVFGVSRSGFYYWIKHRHKTIQREVTRQELDTKVQSAYFGDCDRSFRFIPIT